MEKPTLKQKKDELAQLGQDLSATHEQEEGRLETQTTELLQKNLDELSIEELGGIETQIGNLLSLDLGEQLSTRLTDKLREVAELIKTKQEAKAIVKPSKTKAKFPSPIKVKKPTPETPEESIPVVQQEAEGKVRREKPNKMSSQIEAQIEKPINSYPEDKLQSHLDWLRTQLKWKGLESNKFEELKSRIERRMVFIEKKLSPKKLVFEEYDPEEVVTPEPILNEKLEAEKEKEKLEILSTQARRHLEEQTRLMKEAQEDFQKRKDSFALDFSIKKSYELEKELDEELQRFLFLEDAKNIPEDILKSREGYIAIRANLRDKLNALEEEKMETRKFTPEILAETSPDSSAVEETMPVVEETVAVPQKLEPSPAPANKDRFIPPSAPPEVASTGEEEINVSEKWTEGDEQTLNTLLETIKKSKKRIVELDEMQEASPRTEILSIEEVKQEIKEQLAPLLKKKKARLESINISLEENKFKLEIKLRVGKIFSLLIKATIIHDGDSIKLENHSYEGRAKVKEQAREGIDPKIKELIPNLRKFLEEKYERTINGMQIRAGNLEIALDAKK